LKFGNIHAGKEWLETIQFQFFQHILDQLSLLLEVKLHMID
jgi:hypothetical protein